MRRCKVVLTATLIGAVLLASRTDELAQPEHAKVNIDSFTFSPSQMVDAAGMKASRAGRHDTSRTVTVAGDARGYKSPALAVSSPFSREASALAINRHLRSPHLHIRGTVVVM
jgi:hypothetical protein